jgi:hypothetical protein
VAAQLLVAWSHHGRVRSEAAFARLAGGARAGHLCLTRARARTREGRPGTHPLDSLIGVGAWSAVGAPGGAELPVTDVMRSWDNANQAAWGGVAVA